MATGNPVGGSPFLITVNHDMSLSVRPDVRDFLKRMEGTGGEESNGGTGDNGEDKGEDVDDIVGRMRAGFKQTDESNKVMMMMTSTFSAKDLQFLNFLIARLMSPFRLTL